MGGFKDWLTIAPAAQAACSDLGAMISVNDFSGRPPRAWLSVKCW
jgi:hypothetical protein